MDLTNHATIQPVSRKDSTWELKVILVDQNLEKH